jgi:hypothetical protein
MQEVSAAAEESAKVETAAAAATDVGVDRSGRVTNSLLLARKSLEVPLPPKEPSALEYIMEGEKRSLMLQRRTVTYQKDKDDEAKLKQDFGKEGKSKGPGEDPWLKAAEAARAEKAATASKEHGEGGKAPHGKAQGKGGPGWSAGKVWANWPKTGAWAVPAAAEAKDPEEAKVKWQSAAWEAPAAGERTSKGMPWKNAKKQDTSTSSSE